MSIISPIKLETILFTNVDYGYWEFSYEMVKTTTQCYGKYDAALCSFQSPALSTSQLKVKYVINTLQIIGERK